MVNLPAQSAQSIRVFLVEDSAAIRERICSLLAGLDGVDLAGEATIAAAAISGILDTHPDAVLLDLHLAQGSGIDVLRTVHPQAPGIVFIVVTNLTNSQYRETCIAAGASHFIDKSTEMDHLSPLLAALVATRRQSSPPLQA